MMSASSRAAEQTIFVRDSRLLIALGLAGVFLFASVGKLLDFPEFLQSIVSLGWFPEKYTGIAAVGLLTVEVTTAIFLLLKPTRRLGALLTVALSTIFCFVTLNLLAHGVEGDCSCFGVFLKLPRSLTLVVDIALLVSGLYLLLRRDAAPLPKNAPSKYLLPLSTAFFVASLTLLILVKSNADLQFHIGSLSSDVQSSLSQYQPEADPKAGQTAPPVRLVTGAGQPMNFNEEKNRVTILLFVGECTNCAIRRVTAWNELQKIGTPYRLVVITPDNLTGAKWLQSKVGEAATVVQDNHRMIMEAYNVKWTPRAYVVNHNATLLYCQPRIDDLTKAIEVAGTLLRSGENREK